MHARAASTHVAYDSLSIEEQAVQDRTERTHIPRSSLEYTYITYIRAHRIELTILYRQLLYYYQSILLVDTL